MTNDTAKVITMQCGFFFFSSVGFVAYVEVRCLRSIKGRGKIEIQKYVLTKYILTIEILSEFYINTTHEIIW